LLCAGQNSRIKGDASIAMLSVGSLAIGYLLMNRFGGSTNITGDVCTTLFGSTSILTLTTSDVKLCAILSSFVVAVFIIFYNKIFAVTFDESFAQSAGTRVRAYNLFLAVVVAIIIVLAMTLVGSLLISALIIFPALSAMRVCKSFRGVTICSSVISVVCAFTGILISTVSSTPVGSTIVAMDILAFLLFAFLGFLRNRGSLRSNASILLALLLAFAGGCGKEAPKPPPAEEVSSGPRIDLDLTTLSEMMAYTQVFYIMQKPQDYNGQRIRMQGTLLVTEDPITHAKVFNCNISDSAGCCAKMVPFVRKGNYTWPQDYPPKGTVIRVTGKFEVHVEKGFAVGMDRVIAQLNDAEMEVGPPSK
ncbi:MAG: metal ABC transporter permease, partial [Victivallales bacterium]|nr:metal ABC transporter permease [Victivallales bacterium]